MKMAWKRGRSWSSSAPSRKWERRCSGTDATQRGSSQAGSPALTFFCFEIRSKIWALIVQGHEQEVELQRAAHGKEIAKIQQQLVRTTRKLATTYCMKISGFCREWGYPAGAGACERTRDKTCSGNVCWGSGGQTRVSRPPCWGKRTRGLWQQSWHITDRKRGCWGTRGEINLNNSCCMAPTFLKYLHWLRTHADRAFYAWFTLGLLPHLPPASWAAFGPRRHNSRWGCFRAGVNMFISKHKKLLLHVNQRSSVVGSIVPDQIIHNSKRLPKIFL